MEEVDSVDKDRGLVLPNVGGAEGLAHAVGGGDGVGIHHGDLEAIGKAPGDESVVQVGQPEEDGASVAPRNQSGGHENRGGRSTGIRHVVCDFHRATPCRLGIW